MARSSGERNLPRSSARGRLACCMPAAGWLAVLLLLAVRPVPGVGGGKGGHMGPPLRVGELAAAPQAAARASAARSAPSPEQLRQILERMIASTHRSDAAVEEYARTEHWIERRHAGDADPVLDRVYRVYPTGTGTQKVMTAESGAPVSPEKYREELRVLEQDLVWALDPEESRQQARVVKWKKRTAERYRAVEGFRDAYKVSWLGTEPAAGASQPRVLTKLLLDPKPRPASGSIATDLLAASRLTVWVEAETGAVVRLDAELVRDLRFGGGLLGKIDKGGHVHIEQEQVAPGIWLPSVVSNQVRGRKLLAHAESVRTVETRDYVRVGAPAELLPQVRRELSNAGLQVPAR